MMRLKRIAAVLMTAVLTVSMAACGSSSDSSESGASSSTASENAAVDMSQEGIEEALNLANNDEATWSYDSSGDAWVMSIVQTTVNPVLPDYQGASVCVPGAYVKGIDTTGDGEADVTAGSSASDVQGTLVINYDAEITTEYGQVYTAATAPVIINTGAAGYGSAENTLAGTTYASSGYINVAIGNRGKQSSYEDASGDTVYTGDAPDCLVDQKNAIRFIKYNILLGNLPGNVEYFVSTGGSGGGAHAAMVAATSNNSDFCAYEAECGAVGVYDNGDGTYSTTVTIDGTDYDISDGVWGCIAYSAITSLAEGDMTMAFEYYMDTDYDFGSSFQEQLAGYLSEEYMEYINEQNLSVEESAVGFDLDGDGEMNSTIALTIEYDEEKYADTNGYGGTYLDLYMAEFMENLQWYIDNLDYAEGWTWFDADGNALSDEEVAAMTTADKSQAFIEGRYAKSSSSDGMGAPGGGMGGGPGGGMGGFASGDAAGGGPGGDMEGDPSDSASTDSSGVSALLQLDGVSELYSELDTLGLTSEIPSDTSELVTWLKSLIEDGTLSDDYSDAVDTIEEAVSSAGSDAAYSSDSGSTNKNVVSAGDEMEVGTPDAGTTQASGSSTDSANYSTYDEMLEAYESDIAEVESGDEYGNNQVELYNPLNYIGDDDTDNPTWVRILMGASEGDMSMFASLNMQIQWLNCGIDANIEWQWDGGHVPSEILGESFVLYVDQMYAEYAEDAQVTTIEKPAAEAQTENGDETEATGTDLSSWVTLDEDGNVSFSLADAVSYRTAGASKAIPGFDVIDYGQETYEFGDEDTDARHFDKYLLEVLQEHADELSELFNAE